MNGIIADLFFSFVLSSVEGHDGCYQAMPGGYFASLSSRLEEGSADSVMMTKLGRDSEADALKEYYQSFPFEKKYYESATFPTAVSIEGENRLRHSSLSDITRCDVVSFIDSFSIGTLFISSALLSFRPVSREITEGVLERREKLDKVVVDTTRDSDILLLEEVKQCIEILRDSGVGVSIAGEALSIDGVKGMSVSRRDGILSGLSE